MKYRVNVEVFFKRISLQLFYNRFRKKGGVFLGVVYLEAIEIILAKGAYQKNRKFGPEFRTLLYTDSGLVWHREIYSTNNVTMCH